MMFRFMTLIKDDKSNQSSKKASKPKVTKKYVIAKKSETVKKTAQDVDEKNLEEIAEPDQRESENKDVIESDGLTAPVGTDDAVGDSDDDAGPSTGVRITDEQREENLWILQKLQRNILRRLHLDDDEDDDEDLETSEASSRSA